MKYGRLQSYVTCGQYLIGSSDEGKWRRQTGYQIRVDRDSGYCLEDRQELKVGESQ
jgi:hypothetical protein